MLAHEESLWDNVAARNSVISDRVGIKDIEAAARRALSVKEEATLAQSDEVLTTPREDDLGVTGDGASIRAGSGLYAHILIQHAFGMARRFDKRIAEPRLLESQRALRRRGLALRNNDKEPRGGSLGPTTRGVR
jgi:hypothetical protein